MKILVGVDGSERGRAALHWAASVSARMRASLTLLAVIDPAKAASIGLTAEQGAAEAESMLAGLADELRAQVTGLDVSTKVVVGRIVESIIDAAAGYDLVAVGTHHGHTITESVGGAKGLRVSISLSVPTVVVPADWDADDMGEGIVVGVGPDDSSDAALSFGVEQALALGESLHLVSAWGLPALLAKPAEVMGGGWDPMGAKFQQTLDAHVACIRETHPDLEVDGTAIEGPSPTKTIAQASEGRCMLVLGTHARTVLGRALFGSMTHSVLLNLQVPTAIVPNVK